MDEQLFHPLRHDFIRAEYDSLGRCAVCGIVATFHCVHKFFGAGDGTCITCYQSAYDQIHERPQVLLL